MSKTPLWIEMAHGYRPSIPAYSYIESLPCGDALAGAAAAMGYRLRHGQSVWLSIPIMSSADLGALLRYLHAMRMEAYHEYLQSRWFNRHIMKDRTDLLVWTNRREQYVRLSDDHELGLDMVRSNSRDKQGIIPLLHPDRILRTLLAQQNQHTLQLCEDISFQCSPFSIVVDLTPYGKRGDIATLLETISSYFPGVPLIVLSAIGDFETEQQLRHRNLPLWRQPVGRGLFPDKRLISPNPRVLVANDQTFNEHLMAIVSESRAVKEAAGTEQSGKSIIQAVDQVTSGLRSLAVPFVAFEEYQSAHRKGGPYPVKPIADWLADLQSSELKSGKAQEHLYLFTELVSAILDMISEGVVGKKQALEKWLGLYLKPGVRLGVGVSSEGQAGLLRAVLMGEYPQELADGSLNVIGINSVRDLYRWSDNPLVRWAMRHGQRWAQYLDGDANKPGWWSLQPCPYTSLPTAEVGIPLETWTDCSGQYTHRVELDMDIPNDGDWLVKVMQPIPEPPPQGVGEPEDDDVVVVTEEGQRYSYHRRQRVYALREGGDDLKRVLAEDLLEGDTLVLTDDSGDDCQTLLDVLIQYAADHTENYSRYQMFSDQWESYITRAVSLLGGADALHKALAGEGVNVDLVTVKAWARHARIGPGRGASETAKYVFAVAKLAGMAKKPADVTPVAQAIGNIRSFHQSLGKNLRKLIANAGTPNREIVGKAASLFDQNILADLVHLETIERVIQFPHAPEGATKTLLTILQDHLNISNRVTATSRALKSADNSNFVKLTKVEKCLSLLENEFFAVFSGGDMRLHEAKRIAHRAGITYVPQMSQVTQGQYGVYNVTYNGESVDIGKHLRIGSSFDPELCFRLHFHWDPQGQQIVIHHFGRHLPTRK
ncbi:MAG: hypothetical protein P8X74_05420 [Reinekea sp.]